MNIAIAQMQTISGAFEHTGARMLEFATRAQAAGARLAVFPAFALSGGCPVDEADQEGFISDITECLQTFVEQAPLDCIIPVVGELDGMQMNEVVLVRDRVVHALRLEGEFDVLKQELFGEEAESEPQSFASFEFEGLRFAVAFTSEDLDTIGNLGHAFDVVLFFSTYGFSHDNPTTQLATALTESRYQGDAERMGAWLVAVGSLGVFETQVFSGGSFVLAPWGELAAEAPSFEEALVTCEIDPYSEGPLAQPITPDVPDRLLTLMNALIFGLSGFCRSEGVRDVAIVMDGSLVSSLVATLACDALGPTHVHACVGGAKTPELAAASRELAAHLRIDTTFAPEGASLDHVELMRAELVRSSGALALLNLDKTGFCLENRAGELTVSGLAPLGDVYRSDVVALARLRNTISPVIGPEIMRAWKVPAIEGMNKRYITAASQLEFIDYVLSGRIEWARTYTQLIEEDRGGELAERVLECLRIRRMARLSAPRVLVVSSQSLMESPQSYGLCWHDRVRDRGGQDWHQLGSQLQSLFAAQGKPDTSGIQKEIKDTMAFLRDLALSGDLFGGFAPEEGATDDRFRGPRHGNPGTSWSFGSPFSEN